MNPGLFDDPDALPPQMRQELTLRKALELRRDQWKHEGYLYRSAGDLLLQHGRFYSGRELPESYRHLKGLPGRCFQNALEACEAEPALSYVEGVYAIGSSHYTPHAWCLEPSGKLLEVSLDTTPEFMANATVAESGMPVMPLPSWGYWGAVFHIDFVKAVWATQEGHVGMLDRPGADNGPNAHEWRSEWPVLRVPYSPTRRSL